MVNIFGKEDIRGIKGDRGPMGATGATGAPALQCQGHAERHLQQVSGAQN